MTVNASGWLTFIFLNDSVKIIYSDKRSRGEYWNEVQVNIIWKFFAYHEKFINSWSTMRTIRMSTPTTFRVSWLPRPPSTRFATVTWTIIFRRFFDHLFFLNYIIKFESFCWEHGNIFVELTIRKFYWVETFSSK